MNPFLLWFYNKMHVRWCSSTKREICIRDIDSGLPGPESGVILLETRMLKVIESSHDFN